MEESKPLSIAAGNALLFGKTSGQDPKLIIGLPYGPGISLLDLQLKDLEAGSKTYRNVHSSTSTVAKRWKQPKFLSVNE